MSKEIFIALSGGLAYQRQLEVVSNNVANLSTAGFKADRTVFSVARPEFEKQGRDLPPQNTPPWYLAHSYAAAAQSYVDLSGGAIQVTGDTFDVALEGEGFFAIQGKDEVLYTRAGQFKVNKEGTLVTHENLPVLGEKGPIQISSPNVRINPDGTVVAEGQTIDKLRVERFARDAQLAKVGNTSFSANGATPTGTFEGEVVQGSLERANVEPVRGMLELITVQRNYEAFSKVVANMDEMESKTNARVKV